MLKGIDQSIGPVACHPDVNREAFVLWCRRESKGMPLQMRNGGAIEENILAHFHAEALDEHLQFEDSRGMHDNLQT